MIEGVEIVQGKRDSNQGVMVVSRRMKPNVVYMTVCALILHCFVVEHIFASLHVTSPRMLKSG